MINNNMEMIRQLSNLGDYEEYLRLCHKTKVVPASERMYSHGIGVLIRGLIKYPELSWQEAYMQMYKDFTKEADGDTSDNVVTEETREPKRCCDQGEKKSPSMIKKAKNYVITMKAWIKAGMPVVDITTLANRLSICGKCESLKDYECIECGCPMDAKAKMDMKNLCELNKW